MNDFRKAYALLRLDMLLLCVADMASGTLGQLPRLLCKHMHSSTPVVVKIGRYQGPPVDDHACVQQDGLMSPQLVVLFIDRVEAWLRDTASHCGMPLNCALFVV
jgi:hypothetical protein